MGLKQQLLTERSKEAAENLRVKKVLRGRAKALKVVRKNVENLKKILDKLHEELQVSSRMLRHEILKKENEKKKVLMTLERVKETGKKTTHLVAKEKQLRRKLETLKRKTTAVTSRLRQEKIRFSDVKKRLMKERERKSCEKENFSGLEKTTKAEKNISAHKTTTRGKAERRRRQGGCRRKTLAKREVDVGNC